MSVIINDKRVLEKLYQKNLFTVDELRKISREHDCCIVTDELCSIETSDTYKIISYYRNVKLIHMGMEMINYKREDGTCSRPDGKGAICFTEDCKRDFCERSKNLLIIASHSEKSYKT